MQFSEFNKILYNFRAHNYTVQFIFYHLLFVMQRNFSGKHYSDLLKILAVDHIHIQVLASLLQRLLIL